MGNILASYTMSHINHFLAEVDKVERRRFKESIISARVAQATDKSYQDYMRHLRQAERQQQVATERIRGGRVPMTYEEQMKLESQRHVKFNELSQAEQEKLAAERESLWGQIPEHLQVKARKLAGR